MPDPELTPDGQAAAFLREARHLLDAARYDAAALARLAYRFHLDHNCADPGLQRVIDALRGMDAGPEFEYALDEVTALLAEALGSGAVPPARDAVTERLRRVYDHLLREDWPGLDAGDMMAPATSGREVRDALARHAEALRHHGAAGRLSLPPEAGFLDRRLYRVAGKEGGWIVEFDLWFDGERSDLTLFARLETAGGLSLRINDLRVA